MFDRRDAEFIDHPALAPSDSDEEAIEESLKWNQDEAKRLTKEFHSIDIPYAAK